jgi:hypothetical protein
MANEIPLKENLSPKRILLSIWLSPRKSIRTVLDNNRFGLLLLLAVLGGIAWSSSGIFNAGIRAGVTQQHLKLGYILLSGLFIL